MFALKAPVTAIFQTTYRCNNRCNFCLNVWNEEAFTPKKELGLAEKKEIIDKLVDFGVFRIIFSGGEPTVDPDLKELIKYSSKHKVNVILQTNGRLIKPLINEIKNNVHAVQISLEGTKDVHNEMTGTDSFDQVVENIKLLIKNNVRVFTNITLTNTNACCIEDYLKLLKEIGISEANLTRFYSSGRGKTNLNSFLIPPEKYANLIRKIRKVGEKLEIKINFQGPLPSCFLEEHGLKEDANSVCIAGKTEITVNPMGDVFPCPSWPSPMGNIFNEKLEDIWNSKEMKVLRGHSLLPEKCGECSKLNECNGGCLVSCLNNKKDNYMVD